MCEAGGLKGREGAAKRWMLSLAERLPVEGAAWLGVAPLTGAAEGMLARIVGRSSQSAEGRCLCGKRKGQFLGRLLGEVRPGGVVRLADGEGWDGIWQKKIARSGSAGLAGTHARNVGKKGGRAQRRGGERERAD